MITAIENIPSNVVAFRATDEVTKENYENVVIPEVEKLIKEKGELNYVMVIDTSLSNFTGGAWLRDALLGIKKIGKWHKGAVVSDSEMAKTLTDIFDFLTPGDFKFFNRDRLNEALEWAAN